MGENSLNLSGGNMAVLSDLGNTLVLLEDAIKHINSNSESGSSAAMLCAQLCAQYEQMQEYVGTVMSPGNLRVARSLSALNAGTKEGRPWTLLCQAAAQTGGDRATHRAAYQKLIATGYKPPFGILQIE